jgi:RNase H-fold protein (predicted Holliday junction resolvase)
VLLSIWEGNMKVFELDIGEKRTGFAASDALRCTVQGLTVLNRNAAEVIFTSRSMP